jgi:hypothetical protein
MSPTTKGPGGPLSRAAKPSEPRAANPSNRPPAGVGCGRANVFSAGFYADLVTHVPVRISQNREKKCSLTI